ncbi:bromodomain-containing protein DDB_G0280777-like isoform X2 [Chrysoperla carnea]|uniref:bromodomain-containing protein DDB_G0280777-like isoform X2 n=1 Tax=Chrysoperla carnea TaxID=189513 RepID=UPI001D08EBA9|nr:bromodomain-containing protein DDB_G0280777-like isoform X2 [Chrysoperla carnea]
MKPPSKTKKKSINEYISKLKKQNSILNRALNEEKKITRRLFGSKLAAEQKLDALQKAYNMQLGAINDITNFLKGTLNIFQQKADYLNEIRMEAKAIIDECDVNCHKTSINNHFLKRKAPSAPTRQVVQPMVGGFTIQRPIVNLARLSFSNNHSEVIRNNVQSINRNNVQNNAESENEDEEIEDNSTNSSTEREDRAWITVSPVVRLHPLIMDHRINESENYTENEEDSDHNEDDNIEEDNEDMANPNSSPNNLQDMRNIQSMIDDSDSPEANTSSAFTVDRSVNEDHTEHNGDIQT